MTGSKEWRKADLTFTTQGRNYEMWLERAKEEGDDNYLYWREDGKLMQQMRVSTYMLDFVTRWFFVEEVLNDIADEITSLKPSADLDNIFRMTQV